MLPNRLAHQHVNFKPILPIRLYSRNTPDFAGYTNINQLIADIALNRDWQADLKQYCDEQNIEFMSTPFDAEAVEQLVKIGVKRLKIAGFEASDLHFVKMVAQTKLPLIISAGIGINIAMMEKILTKSATMSAMMILLSYIAITLTLPRRKMLILARCADDESF